MVETSNTPSPSQPWFYEDNTPVGKILTQDRPDLIALLISQPNAILPQTLIFDLVTRGKNKVAYYAMAGARDHHELNLKVLMENNVRIAFDLRANGIPQDEVAQVFTETFTLLFKVDNHIPFDEPIDERREQLLYFINEELLRTVDQVWINSIARQN